MPAAASSYTIQPAQQAIHSQRHNKDDYLVSCIFNLFRHTIYLPIHAYIPPIRQHNSQHNTTQLKSSPPPTTSAPSRARLETPPCCLYTRSSPVVSLCTPQPPLCHDATLCTPRRLYTTTPPLYNLPSPHIYPSVPPHQVFNSSPPSSPHTQSSAQNSPPPPPPTQPPTHSDQTDHQTPPAPSA